MLADQTNRWATAYKPMPQPVAQEDQFDWDSLLSGNDNMFFTGQSTDPVSRRVSGNTRNPFIWGTGNDSLEDAYRTTYDAYYKGSPATTTYFDTWKGPDIRALYGEGEETPTYWQDNNADKAFSSGIDAAYAPKGNPGLQGMFESKPKALPEEGLDLEDIYM